MEPRLLLTAYLVQSTADDGSTGTLRWAINQVNENPGLGTIDFDIPGTGVQQIALLSALPQITNPVLIDGTSEATSQGENAGPPLIQIDGSAAGTGCNGLVLAGGQSVVQGLVISGFSGAGIVLDGGSGNLVQGNQVGTDPSGTIARPNGVGIDVLGSSSNTIGGTAAGAANLISGNQGPGIELVSSTEDSTANLIAGNLIGTAAGGSSPLGNQGSGILIQGATGNSIGATGSAAGNVVSANLQNGIELTSGATANLIAGNLIGTTADGLHALGNQKDGILLNSATSTTIGGPGEGNVISGNLGNGVETLISAPDNLLEGNDIGTDGSGMLALGNGGNGVSLGSSGNTVGGLASGVGNTVAYNGTGSVGAGVQLDGLVNQDTILSNSIHDNAGLGINLGNGPTPNRQPGTAGPNNFQNYPIFTSAKTDGTTTTIIGALMGTPNSTYTVQIFWSPSPDPSGYGEGQYLICTTSAATDSTGNCTFTLTLPVAPPPGAAISATATDDAGDTSEFSPDFSIKGVTSLNVSIVAAPSPVGAGGTLTYTVAVSNTGTLDAHNVVLTDQLPFPFSATSIVASQGSPPTESQGHTVTASLGTVAAGGTATLTIVGTVMTGPGSSVTDTASATLEEIDPTPANLSASVTTPVAAVADLSLAMTSSAGTVQVGAGLTYTITASNQGPSPASNVQISVPLNAGLSFTSASTNQGSASYASGQLTASLGNLAVGAQATVSFVVQAIGVGTISTTASITSDQAEPTSGVNSATVSVVVQPVVDLAVSIAANPSPVAVGQDLVYTVEVVNSGPDAAAGVSLANVLPAGVAFISASSDAGSPPTDSAGAVTAVVGALASGSVATLLITVQPTSSPGSLLVDTASVSGSSAEFDSNPADSTASISVPVRDVSNLGLTMTSSVPSVPIGQTLSFTMTVSNPGPADEPDATLTAPLPPDVKVVSDSSTQGSAPVVGQGMVTADLGALAAGGAATVTLTISPQASALGLLTMSASVQGYNADTEPAQAEASATVTVAAAAGLSVAISPQSAPAHQGQNLTYTLTVANAGPSDDTNVVATSPLPQGTALVSASSSQQAQPTLQAGSISALLGTIAAGQSATVTIVVLPSQPAPAPAGLLLSAAVAGDDFDPVPGDTSASTSVPVLPSDDLAVTLAPVQGTAEVGQDLTLTATVGNLGPAPATGVELQLPLSAGAQLVSATGGPGSPTFQVQSGSLLGQLGSLAVGASTTLTIILQPMIAGPAAWTASVTGDEFDLSPDSQATANVAVAASPGILQFASPTTTVNDTAGSAVISVVRTLGALGTVTAHYQTLQGAGATPGVNYEPASGTLTFAAGQTTGTILVPVLDDSYNSHDDYVALVLTAPTGGAVLGTTTTTVLGIHCTDPDFTPPQVTGLNWHGTATAITSIVLSFSEPLQAASASDPAGYQLVDLGTSGLANPSSGLAIGFSSPVYNAATDTVTLFPVQPLAAGHFYRIQVDGTGVAPISDLAGNLLAGAGAGMTGTNYMALIGQGTTLKYFDQTGNLVTVKVTGGGYLDEVRDPTGNGLVLTLEDGIAHKTVLSGTVARTKGKGRGVTTLGSIGGLGRFGDIRVKLTSPPFLVREYPFSLIKGRSLAAKK